MSQLLSDIKKGKMVEILDFADNTTKCNSARFGIAIGQVVKCIAQIGPVIISRNHQTIAIGKNMSKKIYVREV